MTAVAVQTIPAVRAGERWAFAAVYRRHHAELYRYLFAYLRDHGTAEDLASETFVRALGGAHRLSDTTELLRPWLFRIAQNLLRDHVRSARHRREVTVAQGVDGRDHIPEPHHDVVRAMNRRVILSGLRELSTDQRECLFRRFLLGHSIAETAHSMNRTPQAVRALQFRASRRLAEVLHSRYRGELFPEFARRGACR